MPRAPGGLKNGQRPGRLGERDVPSVTKQVCTRLFSWQVFPRKEQSRLLPVDYKAATAHVSVQVFA